MQPDELTHHTALLILPDGSQCIVPEDGLTIGRRADSGLELEDPQVSRRQANVFYREGALHVADLGSMNGTWLNGVRIDGESPLVSGDVLELGDTKLTVQMLQQATMIAMPVPALGTEPPPAPLSAVIPLRDLSTGETPSAVALDASSRLVIRHGEPQDGPMGKAVMMVLNGVLDIETVDEFNQLASRMVEDGVVQFTLRLDGVEYLDSSGLGALVRLQRQVNSRSGSLELRGLQPAIRGLIQLTRLDRVFAIAD